MSACYTAESLLTSLTVSGGQNAPTPISNRLSVLKVQDISVDMWCSVMAGGLTAVLETFEVACDSEPGA